MSEQPETPAPLTPPDFDICQAEYTPGSFMTLGPRSSQRCDQVALYIAVEAEADDHGRKGAMSLCEDCKNKMLSQLPEGSYRLIRLVEVSDEHIQDVINDSEGDEDEQKQ